MREFQDIRSNEHGIDYNYSQNIFDIEESYTLVKLENQLQAAGSNLGSLFCKKKTS